ncbi:ExbD/TolR family protein [Halarcobacter bivalviorum]|uniref:TonB system transport protein ExbD n=1 Tax=Halarcobacter bivalviorum TaxID=663364 RepID=A0AAX2ABX0_9BACT|nr:biopolymer transporter ExbD [Halarcobacter bivalviorum]AXH12239.1 TonB system transport protein ExbD [Halarcobacter bivalviorum]RXK11345.1 TonB system transport protein ExbD [Halarcobacter bivalviorum]
MKIKKFDSINVIPFIDVLLVLLAIVLMTSTFIAKGVIPVSLPETKSAQKMKEKKEFTIYIDSQNFYYTNKNKISFEELQIELSTKEKNSLILIKSDKKADFETFVSLLDFLKTLEFLNISIVTEND